MSTSDIELKTDIRIDMQSFLKPEVNEVTAFKPLLMSGYFFFNIPNPYGQGSL